MTKDNKKEDIAQLLEGLVNNLTERAEFVEKLVHNIMDEAVVKINENPDLNHTISFDIPVTVTILNKEPKIKLNQDLKSADICALIQILGENIYECQTKRLEIIKKTIDASPDIEDPRIELWAKYYQSDDITERMVIFHQLLENDCLHLKERA